MSARKAYAGHGRDCRCHSCVLSDQMAGVIIAHVKRVDPEPADASIVEALARALALTLSAANDVAEAANHYYHFRDSLLANISELFGSDPEVLERLDGVRTHPGTKSIN